MNQWKVDFSVDGRRSQQIVSCFSSIDARKLIESQYSGSKITIWSITQVK